MGFAEKRFSTPAEIEFRSEPVLSVSPQFKGTLASCLRGEDNLRIVKAKHAAGVRGFAQRAALGL